jgi:hypothetical protein
MNPTLRLAPVLGLLLLLAACATGRPYAEAAADIPPLTPAQGRIYLYRTVVLGAAVQPPVRINDEVVGAAVPGGFFFVDRAPGEYRVSTATEVTRTLSLVLAPGQVRYVRLNIGMGFFVGHVWPELVEEAEGVREIATTRSAVK